MGAESETKIQKEIEEKNKAGISKVEIKERQPIRVAIITSSDMGFAGEREDLSGPEIQRIVEEAGDVVVSRVILPDERKMLSEKMMMIADRGDADLILPQAERDFHPGM